MNFYPNKGSEKEKSFNSLVNKISETHNTNVKPGFDLESKYSVKKEQGLEDSKVISDKYTEEMVQELQDCLPIWVSQAQVLDLLTRSAGNMVEAVSDFYERETEYHEHVIAFRMTSSAKSKTTANLSQTNSSIIPASLPELVSDKGTSNCSVRSILSWETKKNTPNVVRASSKTSVSPKKIGSSKSSVSPKKRTSGLGLDSKPKKKGKSSSALQPTSGSKQSTITKFFSKVLPKDS